MSGPHVSEEQLSRLLDGELALQARSAVLAHLEACPECAARQEALVEVVALLRQEPVLHLGPASADAVLRRVAATPRRQRRGALALVLLVAIAAASALGGLVLVPLGPAVGAAAYESMRVLGPPGIASGRQAVGALALLAVAGPLLAYPLARWR